MVTITGTGRQSLRRRIPAEQESSQAGSSHARAHPRVVCDQHRSQAAKTSAVSRGRRRRCCVRPISGQCPRIFWKSRF